MDFEFPIQLSLPMRQPTRKTKIIATLGPASSSSEVIRQLIIAGMDVARLNFSHGNYENHAKVIKILREISVELDIPVTIMQDLQGPKIRVGKLPGDQIILNEGDIISLVPEDIYIPGPLTIPIDYPYLAEEAKSGMQVLLADGLFGLEVTGVDREEVKCRVIEGGILKSRKGVNFPTLNLKLPSMTDKDRQDLEFGLSQDIDWISLSFVRAAEDVRVLKTLIAEKGFIKPVIAKIEKPQAIEHLEEIIEEVNGIMVARGDLGVELSPEKVPMLQKHIIELCNRKGITVITATQMLESMIHDPLPTRAEASDIANAIIDGTDAIMLSGETAVGDHPVKVVKMMARIATEVEAKIDFKNYPPEGDSDILSLSEAANVIEKITTLKSILIHTTSGKSARFVASERPKTPIYALTRNLKVYHGLNLLWGIKPMLVKENPDTFEGLIQLAEGVVKKYNLAIPGDKILVLGGVPSGTPGGTNFLKIHTVN
jgi:pyruvate kinase